MKSNLKNVSFRFKSGVCGVSAAVALGLGVFWMERHSEAQAPAPGSAADLPTAGVVKVTREDLVQVMPFPAEFRPYVEVELHAKVSGYVRDMNVDFGDKATNGELLATLEVPELNAELTNAMATLAKAQADYTNDDLIYTRLLGVNRATPGLVAEQELDTAQANDLAAAAAIAAARADVEKYQTLVGYTRITAPFDGVVTRRYADPGALIQAGTSSDTQSLPLVRVSDNYLLRLDFPVDVDYVQDVHVGDKAQVRVTSLNNKTFTGVITRFTYDVDDNTRKMTTEIEVPNPDLEIKPGMYAWVDFQVAKRPQALAVPIQAVIAGSPPAVLVVNRDNQIERRAIQLGLEMPDKYEVLSGLSEGESVIVGNQSGFQAGEKVQPKTVQLSMSDEN